MITFDNGGRLVEDASELPEVQAETVYLDLETTSGDPKLDALNPWHHSKVAGVCFTADDLPGAWYVPVNHANYERNIPRAVVKLWLTRTYSGARSWVNHNIKYDAQVLYNDLGVDPDVNYVCTLTQAKIIDSDRIIRGGYGLDALSKTWLCEDIRPYEEALQAYLHKNKDYGLIPPDILGEYGCQDVITNRRLHAYIKSRMPEQCDKISRTEIDLTRVLIEMERNGLGVRPVELQLKELEILVRMTQIDAELAQLAGHSFRSHVNEDCYDVLCNQYGLPVLGYTDEGNPSFDKQALAQYAAHPYAPQEIVKRIVEYRHLNTLNNFFVVPYQRLHINGRLHSSYNQAVRTGRMACKDPNAQQLSPDAKKLIHPADGCTFMSHDYSQIEFRIIAHYINDGDTIDAYVANPDTDFHQWIADLIPMPRRPAKNVNFMMGYGGGKRKCVSMLAANMEVVGDLKRHVDELVASGKVKPEQSMAAFDQLCARKAEHVYNTYHAKLPNLKRTTVRAGNALKARGHVFNLYGRHRHLPFDFAHKAFNALCQSSAADIMKERTVAVWKACRGTPIKLCASVHDETLFEAPNEVAADPRVVRDITAVLEAAACDIRVPIRCSAGQSTIDWLTASKSAAPVQYHKHEAEKLEWLK